MAENRPRRLVLLGPPGSGKGTQAVFLAQALGVPAISTGDMLREAVAAGTELGARVADIMNAGALVDDATMADVVADRLAKADAQQGFILDGYPRTTPQAETLAGILGRQQSTLDAVVLIEVDTDRLVERSLLRGRADDKEDVIRERQRVYHEKTSPLIGYYSRLGLLRAVDGNDTVETVTARLLEAVA